MLKNSFQLNAPYRVAIYARMSTDRQNPRSPDQQIDSINNLIRLLVLSPVENGGASRGKMAARGIEGLSSLAPGEPGDGVD